MQKRKRKKATNKIELRMHAQLINMDYKSLRLHNKHIGTSQIIYMTSCKYM